MGNIVLMQIIHICMYNIYIKHYYVTITYNNIIYIYIYNKEEQTKTPSPSAEKLQIFFFFLYKFEYFSDPGENHQSRDRSAEEIPFTTFTLQ